jgi:hypothetical protein
MPSQWARLAFNSSGLGARLKASAKARWSRLRRVPCCGLREEAVGERQRAGVARLAVKQREDLRRDGRGVAQLAAQVGRGRVEDFHERVARATQLERIEAAAVALLGLGRRLPSLRKRAHDLTRLERRLPVDFRPHGNAAERGVQLARDAEHGVAQLLGGEAAGLED